MDETVDNLPGLEYDEIINADELKKKYECSNCGVKIDENAGNTGLCKDCYDIRRRILPKMYKKYPIGYVQVLEILAQDEQMQEKELNIVLEQITRIIKERGKITEEDLKDSIDYVVDDLYD